MQDDSLNRDTVDVGGRIPEWESSRYKSYTLRNLESLPQVQALGPEALFAMRVVANVLPFKTNNYVVDELIDWDAVPHDPIFQLTFPQAGMLKKPDFDRMAALLREDAPPEAIKAAADAIRLGLNPHPAGQMEHNVPRLDGTPLPGMQHKYRETVLFFPSQGQTCHAYCTFCFRWAQFVGMEDLKFASQEVDTLVAYLQRHPEVTDILFTGGDPMIMKTRLLERYVAPLLEADLPGVQTLRFGTKALGYWPYRFVTDNDADDMLDLFRAAIDAGIHVTIMAHFNHPVELATPIVREAIRRLREVGCEIRTQSPLVRHVNDDAMVWAGMIREQVRLGCVPYYMFVVRDTGAQHYFEVPLVRGWQIYREAVSRVSGLARTLRGPSMSCTPGKVVVDGVPTIRGEKVIALRFLQGREPDWVGRPFYAQYDETATWLTDLKPAFGETTWFFQ
jgi:KamA family protein